MKELVNYSNHGSCTARFNDIVRQANYAIQLQAENEKLIEALDGLIWNAANNTGKEPSLSCFYLALIEAKKALKQAKGE